MPTQTLLRWFERTPSTPPSPAHTAKSRSELRVGIPRVLQSLVHAPVLDRIPGRSELRAGSSNSRPTAPKIRRASSRRARHGGLLLSGQVRLGALRRAPRTRPAAQDRSAVLADDLVAAVVPQWPCSGIASLPARDGGTCEHQSGIPQGEGRFRGPRRALRRAARRSW